MEFGGTLPLRCTHPTAGGGQGPAVHLGPAAKIFGKCEDKTRVPDRGIITNNSDGGRNYDVKSLGCFRPRRASEHPLLTPPSHLRPDEKREIQTYCG